MELGLLEVLRGQFADGTPVLTVGEDRRRLRSVVDNLNRLFNCRRGTIDHLPLYGLPDTGDLYESSPEAIDRLRRAIKETVERYEPRLQRVVVEAVEEEVRDARMVLVVSGSLVGGEHVEFQTVFVTASSVQVRLQRVHS